MSSLSILGFSENMQYLFTNRGVTKLSLEENDLNGKNMVSYTYENLNVAVDILKENIQYQYKIGKISLLEYTSHPRKFLYKLMEIFKPNDSITIIKEWEQHFGDKLLILNESTDTLLIEQRINQSWESFKILFEDWYNPAEWGGYLKKGIQNVGDFVNTKTKQAGAWVKDQKKQIQNKGFGGYLKDKATSVWNSIKSGIAKAWKCISSNPAECIMEGMRKLVFTAAGTAALTGLSMIPVIGQVSNSIIFGSLLIWDVYKMMSSKYESGEYQFNIMDIVVDCISLLLPALGKVVKTAGLGIKSVGQLAKAASKGGVLGKAVMVIKNGLSKIMGFIGQAAKWLGDKLGFKSLANWGAKASSKVSQISKEISAGTKTVSKSVSNVGTKISKSLAGKKQELAKIWKTTPKTMPTRQKLLTAMGKSFAFTSIMCSALGLDGFKCRDRYNHNSQSKGFTEEELKTMETALADIELTSL
jgi:hypothetical protein